MKGNVQVTIRTSDELFSLSEAMMDHISKFVSRVQELFDLDQHQKQEMDIYLYIPDNSELANVSSDLDFFVEEASEPLFLLRADINPRFGGPYGEIDYDLMFENQFSAPYAGIKQDTVTVYVGEKYAPEDYLDQVEYVVERVCSHLYEDWKMGLEELKEDLGFGLDID